MSDKERSDVTDQTPSSKAVDWRLENKAIYYANVNVYNNKDKSIWDALKLGYYDGYQAASAKHEANIKTLEEEAAIGIGLTKRCHDLQESITVLVEALEKFCNGYNSTIHEDVIMAQDALKRYREGGE